jgi:hypothetical protein
MDSSNDHRLSLTDLRAFARRDWAVLARLKEEHLVQSYREHGFRASRALALALYDHARAHAPDFPSEDERRLDLEHHIYQKRLIDKASNALTLR